MTLLIAVLIAVVEHPLPAPGLWEFTIESTIDGKALPQMKSTRCFTAEELEKRRCSGHSLPSGDCTFTVVKDEPGHMIRTFNCRKLDSAGTFETMQTKDGWANVMKGTVRGKSDEQRMTMRRIGDCR